jgi:serine/threonine-protein kinase
MVGKTISHYRVLEKLGEGGMGVVYKAKDTHLDRLVAIKLLPAERVADPERKRRFIQEAKAASALNHPNIITIYDIDQADGLHFIAMEYVAGKTLDQLIGRKALKLTETLKYAIQVADALAAAHAAGVVHRDLKPANIMVTEKGLVKVLDFGLAKLTEAASGDEGETLSGRDAPRTEEGAILGTAAYMSPEQASGEKVDHRSDIFCFGVVAYQMLTGQPAFQRSSLAATLAAVLRDEPAPLRVLAPQTPPCLEEVVSRCLRKAPGERFQTAAELRSALHRAYDPSDQASLDRKRALPAVAVLAFTDMSPARDQEYFCDGIAEEILNGLARIKGLRVASRTSAFRYKGQAVDICELGRQLKVDTVLEGSVRKSGNRLRISAQLINVADGFHLWSERYDRTVEDIFDIQDGISEAIVGALKLTLQPREQEPLRRRHTRNAAAYNSYLKGRYCWNRRSPESLKAAIGHFQEALACDPGYAAAYAGLADCFCMLGMQTYLPPKESMPQALAAARRALELDDSSAESHVSLAGALIAYEWDWSGARTHLEQAIQLNPEYATAYHWYGVFLCAARGQEDAAIRALRRAEELDPLSLPIGADLALTLVFLRRYQEAVEQCRRVIDLDSSFFRPYLFLGRAYTHLERWDEALDALIKARELSQRDSRVEAALGFAYARSGQYAEAVRMMDWLKTTAETRYISPCETAIIAAGLGDPDMAFEWLDRSLLDRSGWHVWLKVDPYWDSIRGDPRYSQLLIRMGLGETGGPAGSSPARPMLEVT